MNELVWIIPVVAIIAALVFLGVRGGLGRIVRGLGTRKMSWDERDQMERKRQLLAFDTLREFYAPRDEFQREWDPDKKKPTPKAWLSLYPEAVKAAWKAARKDSPSRLALVRQQVDAAAQSFVIETLPEEEQPHNSGTDHFNILLDLNGKPYEQVAGLAPALKSQLRLHSLDEADNGGDFGSVRLIGHAVKPEDRLEKVKPDKQFLDENPATDLFKFPLAVTEKGKVWQIELHHALIYALTGGGKTFVLHALIYQLAPFVRAGLVELWIADIKGTFARPYGDSSLINRKATDLASIEKLLADFDAELMARIAELESVPEDEQDRFGEVTPQRKLKVLLFDEITGTIIKARQNRRSVLLENATNITLLGRELNFLLVGAAQIVRRDIMEDLRVNMVNRITLRAESRGWSSFMLFGDHEDKRGPQFDASQIELANEANGYKTAGIGYARGEDGTPDRLRFAFVSKAQVRALAATFPRRVVSDEVPMVVEESIHDEEATITFDEPRPTLRLPEEGFTFDAPAGARATADDGFTPMTHEAAHRSQVDELAEVREWPQEKLLRAQERFTARLAQQDSAKGRAWLSAIEAQIRLNDRMAVQPRSADDDDTEIALPSIY